MPISRVQGLRILLRTAAAPTRRVQDTAISARASEADPGHRGAEALADGEDSRPARAQAQEVPAGEGTGRRIEQGAGREQGRHGRQRHPGPEQDQQPQHRRCAAAEHQQGPWGTTLVPHARRRRRRLEEQRAEPVESIVARVTVGRVEALFA